MAFELRPEWLGLVEEEILEPERRIVDPHHHFFTQTQAFPHYRLEDLWADTSTHNVEQTVFVQCEEHHYEDGPEELRPVGETEWVDGIAAEARKGPEGAARVGAIVGTANLCLGERVRGEAVDGRPLRPDGLRQDEYRPLSSRDFRLAPAVA